MYSQNALFNNQLMFLDCYPFYEKDPFVINESPHVFFIGNQPKFDTKLIEGNGDVYWIYLCTHFLDENGVFTRIILVPDFSETRTIVLVNINDLSVIPLKISS